MAKWTRREPWHREWCMVPWRGWLIATHLPPSGRLRTAWIPTCQTACGTGAIPPPLLPHNLHYCGVGLPIQRMSMTRRPELSVESHQQRTSAASLRGSPDNERWAFYGRGSSARQPTERQTSPLQGCRVCWIVIRVDGCRSYHTASLIIP